MMEIALSLFGSFAVTVHGQPVTTFATDKARCLLAYLALQPAQAHRRETLAALFWPELTHQAALTNLRQTFHRLREAFARVAPGSDEALFLVTRQTLQLDAAVLTVDVARFTALLTASESHAHASLATCAGCLERLAHAATLYRGELLAGVNLADAAPFEEWLLLRREFYHQQALLLLQKLTSAHAQRDDDEVAHRYAARQLALDPYREAAHRAVITLLARQGLISQALAQYERCRQILHDELGVVPDPATVALIEQIRTGRLDRLLSRPDDGPPALATVKLTTPHPISGVSGQPVIPHNLPAQLTPLVGRAAAVTDLCARLQDRTARLVTIVGAGGMGKTRLALAVGAAKYALPVTRDEAHPYPDGIFFVPLAALTTATEVAPAIATTLGLPLQGNPQGAVIHGLRAKRLLLILDNFEHLLDAAPFVIELLQGAPEVQILVTARERLQVRGEHLYAIAPLDYGEQGGEQVVDMDVDAVGALAAVQLFIQSAQRTQADFGLTAANVAAVLQICRLVQGMPLGVELATAWVGTLPLPAIADAISQSFDFLAVDWRDAPPRQRSMRAVFAWSWGLLSPTEQQILRQLAIFQGAFTLTASAQVADAPWPHLARLVEKSLLLRAPSATEERFAMHELLRQFAREQGAAFPAEQALTAANHGHYYLTFLADHTPQLAYRAPHHACAAIQVELDNIRQAWLWGAAHGAIALLRHALFSWWQFCVFRGLEFEGRRTFAQAVTALRAWLATQLDASTYKDGQQLLSALVALHANYLFAQGQDEEMAARAREAIAVGEQYGSQGGVIFGHFVLGRAFQEFGRPYDAAGAWTTAIERAQAVQADAQADALVNEIYWMAHVWLHGNRLALEKYEESRALLAQALHFCQTAGKVRGQMECGSSLALSHFFRGDYLAAQQQYEQVLQLAQALGAQRQAMVSQVGLGTIHLQFGNYLLARTLLQNGVTQATAIGAPYYEALGVAALVRLHSYLGDHAAAARWVGILQQLLERTQLPKECQSEGQAALALHAYYAEAYALALHHAEQAVQQLTPTIVASRKAGIYLLLGHARTAMNQLAAAAAAYQQTIASCARLGNVFISSEAEAGLAQLALLAGDGWQALQWVEAILPVLTEHPAASAVLPFFTYLTSYQVLAANADARAATVLAQAQRLLHERAAGITDPALQQRFLEGSKVQRVLQQLG